MQIVADFLLLGKSAVLTEVVLSVMTESDLADNAFNYRSDFIY